MNASGRTPTAEGSLEKTPLVHLLVYLADRRLSGTMTFGAASSASCAVYFQSGAPSKVKISEPIAHLGRVISDMGLLTEELLEASLLAIGERPELQGEFLVRTGAITRPALLTGLREQTSRKLAHVFALPPETPYAFFHEVNLLESWGGPELTPLDPLATVWRAICARPHEPIVAATLSRLGSTVLKLHPQSDVARFGFSHHELSLIDLLRARPSPLARLVESQLLAEHSAQLVLYALVVTRHIDHRSDGAMPVGIERAAPAPSSAPEQSGPISTSVRIARVKLATRRVEAPSEVPEPPTLPTALTEQRDLIVARAGSIDRQDYFAILGLTRDAAQTEVQSAYFALAKAWHPDRLPAELEALRESASKVFARMNEAFETLSDPARRKRYVETLEVGSGTPEESDEVQRIIRGASDFQRAEILWRNRDVAGAEPYIRRAYAADPHQSDYAALYALLELAKRPGDAAVDDLLRLCDDAIARSERCERAFFCRALLKKRLGQQEAAISDFRSAYALNSKNLDAAREVRVYEMRRAKQGDRRAAPASRRSTPPASKMGPGYRSTPPQKPSQAPKDGGMLAGIGKLFKR